MNALRVLFLDNPFLVKAFRARRHGGKVYLVPVLFVVVALFGLGLTLELARRSGQLLNVLPTYLKYYDALYLTALLGITALMALSAVSQAIIEELSSGTLEFQRLTTLSMPQIVLGKAIGEPVSAYLLTFAAAPLLVITSLMGGYPLPYKLFGLLLCFTTIFVMACMGAIVPVRAVEKGKRAWSPLAGALLGFGWFLLPVVVATRCDGVAGLLFGLITPLPYVVEAWIGKFFSRSVLLAGGWEVTIDLITPVTQIIGGLLSVSVASRILRQDDRPPLNRAAAYVLAIVGGALQGAVLAGPPMTAFGGREASCLFPLVLGGWVLLLFVLSTPARDGYTRWIWRDSEKGCSFWRYAFADRSPGWWSLALLCLITAMLFVFVGFPYAENRSPLFLRYYLTACVVVLLTLVSYGAAAHVLSLTFGRGGLTVMVLFELVLLILGPTVEFLMRGAVDRPPSQWNLLAGGSLPMILVIMYDSHSLAPAGAMPLAVPVGHFAVFLAVRLLVFGFAATAAVAYTRYRWQKIMAKKAAMGVIPGDEVPVLQPAVLSEAS